MQSAKNASKIADTLILTGQEVTGSFCPQYFKERIMQWMISFREHFIRWIGTYFWLAPDWLKVVAQLENFALHEKLETTMVQTGEYLN